MWPVCSPLPKSNLNLQPGTAPTGNGPVRTYRIPGAQGTVGFISPLGEHFYETCNRLRLTEDGKLRACLFKTGELDLRPALNESQPLEPHIQECVRRKPAGHELWLKDISVESNRVPKIEKSQNHFSEWTVTVLQKPRILTCLRRQATETLPALPAPDAGTGGGLGHRESRSLYGSTVGYHYSSLW
jgi:hypothetical protein